MNRIFDTANKPILMPQTTTPNVFSHDDGNGNPYNKFEDMPMPITAANHLELVFKNLEYKGFNTHTLVRSSGPYRLHSPTPFV
jgi:hypothetical protein